MAALRHTGTPRPACVWPAPQISACLDRAHRWAQEQPLPAYLQLVFRDHPLYLTHAQLLLHESRSERDGARSGLELVRKVLKLLEPSGALGLTLEASVPLALFEDALGRPADALQRSPTAWARRSPEGTCVCSLTRAHR